MTLAMRRTSVMSEPMPRIMRLRGLGAAAIHRRAHGLDACRETREHGLADQKMPDVELDDLGQRRDRLGAGIVEPVAGMHLETETACASFAPSRIRRHSASAAALSPSNSA